LVRACEEQFLFQTQKFFLAGKRASGTFAALSRSFFVQPPFSLGLAGFFFFFFLALRVRNNSRRRNPPHAKRMNAMQTRPIALVCASNQNRSVEAHGFLLREGYTNLSSFGTSNKCKLPGPSIDKPNVYPFGTPYAKIYEDLKRQDPDL
jgi:hypothetical protein